MMNCKQAFLPNNLLRTTNYLKKGLLFAKNSRAG